MKDLFIKGLWRGQFTLFSHWGISPCSRISCVHISWERQSQKMVHLMDKERAARLDGMGQEARRFKTQDWVTVYQIDIMKCQLPYEGAASSLGHQGHSPYPVPMDWNHCIVGNVITSKGRTWTVVSHSGHIWDSWSNDLVGGLVNLFLWSNSHGW